MIFFAVAAPTPGSASRSFCEAVFRSTEPAAGCSLERFADLVGSDDAPEDSVDAPGADGREVVALDGCDADDPLAVTIGEILSMVLAEIPAFDRSEGLE